MRKDGAEELDSIRHQMVSLEPTYLLFGYGRHAWYVPDIVSRCKDIDEYTLSALDDSSL